MMGVRIGQAQTQKLECFVKIRIQLAANVNQLSAYSRLIFIVLSSSPDAWHSRTLKKSYDIFHKSLLLPERL